MRRAQPDIFKRKIVITIPPWAIPVLVGGVVGGIAIPVVFNRMMDAIAFTLTLLALAQMVMARKMLKRARWDIHRMLRDIGNDDIPDDAEEPPTRIIDFPRKVKEHVNSVSRHG
jgi:hypothetical protein